MRILWLSHMVPFPPKGGVLQRAYHLLRQTAARHEVHLIALVQKDLFKIHFPDIASALRESKAGLDFCTGMSFHDIPADNVRAGRPILAARSLLSRYPYTINWLHSETFAAAVARFIESEPVDLVHFDTIGLVPYRTHCSGVAMALDHHNVESQMMLRRAMKESNPLKKLYFFQESCRIKWFEQRVCATFGSNLMCSDLDAQRLRDVCPTAATDVIPNGIDLDYFRPQGHRVQAKRCIFVGRLNSYPNAEAVRFIAKELWPRLKSSVPGVSFDIVGANPPKEALALAERDPAFRVLGFVDDVRPLMDAADVYVCPMFDGGGTRLKVLDAMAMEKPIIATPLAVEGIQVASGKEFHSAELADDFVSGISRLFAEPAYAAGLAAAARRSAVENYSYSAIGEKLSQTFENLAQAFQVS